MQTSPQIPAIAIRDLHKRFDTGTVLGGVDCEIRAGESFGLIGANGAGKTTLLKLVLDYLSLDRGRIEVFGVDSRQAGARRRLAFLPERFVPPYYLRGRDFLAYVARLHGVTLLPARVEEIFAVVELGPEALQRSVRQFSKGMAQKLGLAAAFLSGKELLILDEPMSGLDPGARASIRRHLLALRESGTTLFFTTHLLSDVETLCDRVGILDRGSLRFDGTPGECMESHGGVSLEQAYLRTLGRDVA